MRETFRGTNTSWTHWREQNSSACFKILPFIKSRIQKIGFLHKHCMWNVRWRAQRENSMTASRWRINITELSFAKFFQNTKHLIHLKRTKTHPTELTAHLKANGRWQNKPNPIAGVNNPDLSEMHNIMSRQELQVPTREILTRYKINSQVWWWKGPGEAFGGFPSGGGRSSKRSWAAWTNLEVGPAVNRRLKWRPCADREAQIILFKGILSETFGKSIKQVYWLFFNRL